MRAVVITLVMVVSGFGLLPATTLDVQATHGGTGNPFEIVANRTMYSKEYDNGDGTHTINISSLPFHYYEAGGWLDIDTNIISISNPPYIHGNIANNINASFTGYPNPNQMKIDIIGTYLESKIEKMQYRDELGNTQVIRNSVNTNQETVSGYTITYPAIFQDTNWDIDLIYKVHPNKLENNIVINNPSTIDTPTLPGANITLDIGGWLNFPSGTSFYIDNVSQSSVFSTTDIVEIRDSTGDPIFNVTPPIFHDQNDEFNRVEGSIRIDPTPSSSSFFVQIPNNWLSSLPQGTVVMSHWQTIHYGDPTDDAVVFKTGDDAWDDYPFGEDDDWLLLDQDGQAGRAVEGYIRFYKPPNLDSSDQIIRADAFFRQAPDPNGHPPHTQSEWGAFEVLDLWKESGNSPPAITGNNAPITPRKPVGTRTWTGWNDYRAITITPLVQEWIDKEKSNFGIALKRVSGNDYPWIYSKEAEGGTKRPFLQVKVSADNSNPVTKTRFVSYPYAMMGGESYSIKYYQSISGTTWVELFIENCQDNCPKLFMSFAASGVGIHEVNVDMFSGMRPVISSPPPAPQLTMTLSIKYNTNPSIPYDPKEIDYIYKNNFQDETGPESLTLISDVGDDQQGYYLHEYSTNDYTSWSKSIHQYVDDPDYGGNGDDYAKLYADTELLPYDSLNGDMIKVNYKITQFVAGDTDWWTSGVFSVFIQFYDAVGLPVYDNDGKNQYRYVIAYDYGDDTILSDTTHRKVLRDEGGNPSIMWYSFEENVKKDYKDQPSSPWTTTQWNSIKQVKIRLSLIAWGTLNDNWEIWWDDLSIEHDGDGDELSDTEEEGTSAKYTFNIKGSTFAYPEGHHHFISDSDALNGDVYEALHGDKVDWVKHSTYIPSGRYRIYVNIKSSSFNSGESTETWVYIDNQFIGSIISYRGHFQKIGIDGPFLDAGKHEFKLVFKKANANSGNVYVRWDYIQLVDVGAESEKSSVDSSDDWDGDSFSTLMEARPWHDVLNENLYNGNPSVPDVFIEVDYMSADHWLSQTAKNKVIDTFASNNIVVNIDDGIWGGGEEVPHSTTDTLCYGDCDGAGNDRIAGNNNDFGDYLDTYFTEERQDIFHYALMSHRVEYDGTSSWGIANTVVAYGGHFAVADGTIDNKNYAGSTFIHESGHTIGLHNGPPPNFDGIDTDNYDFDEYPSVMNYNAPSDFYGFSNGPDSSNNYNDWKHMEFDEYL